MKCYPYMNCQQPLLLGPQGNCASGEGAGDIDEALVAAAAKVQGNIAFCLNKRPFNKDIKLSHDIKQSCIGDDFLPGVTSVAPHVVTQLLLDAVDKFTRALRLLQGVTATQGDWRLIIGDDLHQFVKGAFLPTLEIPRLGIVATWAMVIAASQIN